MSNFNDYTFLGSFSTLEGADAPMLEILPPDVSGSPTQLEWSIGFVWTYPVENFTIEDIKIKGDISGTPITKFSGSGYDYTSNLVLKSNSQGSVTLTIEADSVTGNGTTGPPEDVSITIDFDTRDKEPVPNILCVRRLNNSLNNDLGLGLGGVFRNVLSMAKLGDYIYIVCQIQRHGQLFGSTSPTAGGILTFLDDGATEYIQGGAVLYRVDTTDCTFEIIKRYKSVTTAARSLVAYNNRMYGLEGSHYAHLNDGMVYDAEQGINRYERSRFRDVDENWKRECGSLFSISNTETEITQHGIITSANPEDNPYFDPGNPDAFYGIHYGSASPLQAETGGVTGVLGYGNYDKVTDRNAISEVSRYKNLAWVSLNTQLNRRIPILATNDRSAFDVISEVARMTNSIIYFEGNRFIIKPRDVEGDATRKLTLNSLSLEQPIDDISVYTDVANLWNAVEINYGENKVFSKDDKDSIDANRKRNVYTTSMHLDDSNLDWIKWIADSFLKRFSTIRNIVVCQLKPSPHLKRGDIVEIDAPERVFLSGKYQVIGTSHLILENRSEVRFVSL